MGWYGPELVIGITSQLLSRQAAPLGMWGLSSVGSSAGKLNPARVGLAGQREELWMGLYLARPGGCFVDSFVEPSEGIQANRPHRRDKSIASGRRGIDPRQGHASLFAST
jgi:hypothetical protein